MRIQDKGYGSRDRLQAEDGPLELLREAKVKPLSIQQGMPLLSYETDACAVASAVLRQVKVPMQQVLDHSARTR